MTKRSRELSEHNANTIDSMLRKLGHSPPVSLHAFEPEGLHSNTLMYSMSNSASLGNGEGGTTDITVSGDTQTVTATWSFKNMDRRRSALKIEIASFCRHSSMQICPLWHRTAQR